MVDSGVTFCGVKFKNPIVLASGILGLTASTWRYVARNGAGGITTKSIWRNEHKGHPSPVIIANEHYALNAVGLPDAGCEKAREEIGKFLKWKTSPLIASIVAGKIEDFGIVAEEIARTKPHIIEVNISCPNVEDESGKPFACAAADAAKVTAEVKKRLRRARAKIPVVIKLSPNVENIVAIAKACADAGADGFTVMNTLGPGMAIDIESRRSILANKVGGLSGPALKPIAVRHVYDIYKALKMPIIGMGGVLTGQDAIEMMMAGATLVGVGTAVYYRGQDVFGKIADEMKEWCNKHKIEKISSLIGAAHDAAQVTANH